MEFRVLGPIEAWESGRSIELGPRMPRAVLSLLLMDVGRVVSVGRLVDQLWGDEPPPTATTALQGYVSHLRRALEPDRPARTPPRILVTQSPGYVLRTSPQAVDALRFETLAEKGQRLLNSGRFGAARDALSEALRLWRGTPYADFAFEPFAADEIARLSELRAGAADCLAEADLALGGHAGAVAELEQLVAAEPLREQRWELLALAMYRCGRQANALRALDKARRILREELGIEPGPSLRRLERDIFAQAPSLDWRPPIGLPWAPVTAAPRRVGPAPVAPGEHETLASTPDHSSLVGRDRELDELLAALDAACRSAGRVVLVSGEPGIGKTRLLEELTDVATRRDIFVAWGRCIEGEAAPAYWPWAQIIRGLLDERDPLTVRAALGVGAPELALIVPEVKEVMGEELAPLPVLEPEAARARLYEGVVRFVLRLAAEAPIVLVVDDLHWADVPSLHLVRLLAAQLAHAAVMLVCTYRDVEADSAEPVLSTLAAVARSPGVVRMRPRGLDDEGVAQLVAAAIGTEASAGVAATIRARTEGNPFFVSEVVSLLAVKGELSDELVRREIPARVRDVIHLRLARLPAEAVSFLGLAAVIGRTFDFDVLVRAAGLDDERALDLLEAAVLTGVVIEDTVTVGRYRFSHALVWETVYDGLSGVRRPRLHRRVAEVLQHLGGDDDGRVFEIARHLRAAAPAGTAEEAFDWAVRAAGRATARLAFEEAEEQLRGGIELLSGMPAGPEKTRRELSAQVQLGAVLFMTRGYCEPAVGEAWSRARELCRDAPDVPELLPTLWGLWAFACVRADFPIALEIAEELLEHGRRTGNTVFAAIGHETMGITCWHQGRLAEARDHLEEGTRLCDTLPPEVFTGVLLEKHPGVACRSFAGVVLWLRGDERPAVEVANDAVAFARRLAHPFSVVVALFFDAWLRVLLGDRDGVVARAEEGIALARTHGFRQFVAMLEILLGWATHDLAAMEQGFGVFLDTGSRMLQHFFLGLMADVQRRAGRSAEALATVERALAEGAAVGERFWEAELHRLRAELIGGSGGDEALSRALEVARSQGARALEARIAATVAPR